MKAHTFGAVLTSLAIASAIFLPANGDVSALTYQTEVDVDFTFNPVVNLAVSGDLIISDLSPGNSSDSNIITITAGSNSAYGYTLYSTVGSSSSNYTDLRLSPSNSTNRFTNLSANKATLSAFSDNTWGYSYCNFTSNANACNTTSNWVSGNVGSTSAGYNGLPLYNSSNQESGIMLINSTTPSETNLKFKIGAKASTAQASGTYSNVINFIGVGKVVTTSYTISYNGNGGTGTPANQTGTTDTGAVKLTATAPTKEDYIFKGWCDADNTSDPTTCSGNTTQAGHIFGLNTTASSITKNLYAVWEETLPDTLQKFASSNYCSKLSIGNTMTLQDSRDDQDYTIAKLADGKCWMTKNLNIAGGTQLSSDDTDFDSSYTLPTTNGWTVSSGKLVLPASSTSGFSANNTAYVYNTGNNTNTCTSPGCYSYYSWDAATLGSGRSLSTDNTDAPYSICPKGWKLPTSRTTSATDWQTASDFYALAHQYGLDSTTSTGENDNDFYTLAGPGTIPGFLMGGYYASGSFTNGGSAGYYWSATSFSSSEGARYLYFDSPDVDSAYAYYRSQGYSVRCVIEPKYYMQNISSSTLASLMPNTGDTAVLTDKRDGQNYTVSKLADGKYWMLDNLALNLTDSDVQSAMLNSADTKTNASYETLGYLFNGGGTTSDRYPTAGVSTSTSYSYSAARVHLGGDCYSTNKCANDPESGKWTKDSVVTNYGAGNGKIGIYYNYCATSAGSYCFGNGSSAGTSSGNATEDICPTSWRLPTMNEYGSLSSAYSHTVANINSAFSTAISGYDIGSSAYLQNGSGYYWTSTRGSDSSFMYYYYFDSSSIEFRETGRHTGQSMRCLIPS